MGVSATAACRHLPARVPDCALPRWCTEGTFYAPQACPVGRMRKALAFALIGMALAPVGCVAPAPSGGSSAPTPTMAPEHFFVGGTEGEGTLAVVMRRPHAVHVTGSGHIAPDGALVLAQSVDESGRPRRQRQWSIRQVSPGRYVGTLSDATSPVTGEVDGNLMRLRFRMAGGLAAEQRLYLQPDGRTVLNRMTVRKLGIVVAVLSETIRKVD